MNGDRNDSTTEGDKRPVAYDPNGPYNWGPAITGPRTAPLPIPETVLLPTRDPDLVPERRGLGAATGALLLAGLYGIPVGIVTGLCVGVWFFVIGALYGAAAGVPAGFVAGIFGAAIGARHHGFRIAGLAVGLLGGLLMGFGFFSVITGPLTAVAGYIAGGRIDARTTRGGPHADGTFHRLQERMWANGLYAWPLGVRLLLAVGNLLALAAVGAEGYVLATR